MIQTELALPQPEAPPSKRRHVTPRRTPPGLAGVIDAFMRSPEWDRFSRNTRLAWGRELRLALDALGDLPLDAIRPKHVQDYLDGFRDRPGKQHVARTALRRLENFGLGPSELLTRPITRGVKIVRATGGHQAWTQDDVDLALAHASPVAARVIRLAVETGQRGSDLIRMRWTNLRINKGIVGIDLVTQKTRRPMWVPLDPDFAAELATWRTGNDTGPILRKRNGDPFNRNQLTDLWTRERRDNPHLGPLAGRVLHGLRATAIVRLQQVGATSRQIAELVGMSERMVEHYTRNSSQEDNALAAMAMLLEHRRNRRGDSL